ncbi:MAG: hypothetical protein PHW82_12750 [Bacteroidales bacterium]|nr:hypothetical protein [Bacteroidales bacterium]
MKKVIMIFGAVLFSALLMTSCVSTNRGFQSSPVLSRNVELDPIKADIKVDEKTKIKGESTSSYFLSFRISGDNTVADGINYSTDASASPFSKLNPLKLAQAGRLNKVRGAAAYKALNTGDYDVLVHPTYTTTVENYLIFKKYIVKVEGYGAKYENFRTERQKIVILEDGTELILQDD